MSNSGCNLCGCNSGEEVDCKNVSEKSTEGIDEVPSLDGGVAVGVMESNDSSSSDEDITVGIVDVDDNSSLDEGIAFGFTKNASVVPLIVIGIFIGKASINGRSK